MTKKLTQFVIEDEKLSQRLRDYLVLIAQGTNMSMEQVQAIINGNEKVEFTTDRFVEKAKQEGV